MRSRRRIDYFFNGEVKEEGREKLLFQRAKGENMDLVQSSTDFFSCLQNA